MRLTIKECDLIYKGKTLSTGDWVRGGFHKHEIMTPNPLATPDEKNEESLDIRYEYLIISDTPTDYNLPQKMNFFEVDKDTLCRSIGYREKVKVNGNVIYGDYIFTQDIVEMTFNSGHKIRFFIFRNKITGFIGAKSLDEEGNILYGPYDNLDDFIQYYNHLNDIMSIKVIGNRFDNPDLIN